MKLHTTKYELLTVILFLAFLFNGWVYDNYDTPSSNISGEITYQGETLGVKSNEVELELWQPGYDYDEKIPIHLAQDGTFNTVVFDGTYKLTLFNGPSEIQTDSITVQLNREETVSVEVVSFFTIENETISNNGEAIEATLNIDVVTLSQQFEFVGQYLGRTSIVDRINFEESSILDADEISSLSDPVNLSSDLPEYILDKGYVFARIGVKTIGIPELLYSQDVKIDL